MEVYGRDGRKHKLSIITLPCLNVSIYVDGVHRMYTDGKNLHSDLYELAYEHGFNYNTIMEKL